MKRKWWNANQCLKSDAFCNVLASPRDGGWGEKGREKNSPRKKKDGETRGGKGEGKSSPPPSFPSPRFPIYKLTRSPLTAALYYLKAWNRLEERVLPLTPLSHLHESKYMISDLFVTTNLYFADQWADCSHAESWSDDWLLTQAWISLCCYCAALPKRKTKKVCTSYLNFSFYTQAHSYNHWRQS